MMIKMYSTLITMILISSVSFAQDLTETWQQIDDKTGLSEALIEIKQLDDGNDVGNISKLTPDPGYRSRETCFKSPKPFIYQPILDSKIFQSFVKNTTPANYGHDRVLDILIGKIYDLKGHIQSMQNA